MKGIDILVEQHENVLVFVDVVKDKCLKIFNKEEEVDLEFFNKVIDFGRNYVDAHHHKEEEDILFRVMVDTLGESIAHIINDAMLFEHNVGRMYLMNLKYAIQEYEMFNEDVYKLAIVSNAFGYVSMMEEHINKENEVLYPYADKNLDVKAIKEFENEVKAGMPIYVLNLKLKDERTLQVDTAKLCFNLFLFRQEI